MTSLLGGAPPKGGAPRKRGARVPGCSTLEVTQWHERDRAHVELRRKSDEKTVAEWWDDDVAQMVEGGLFKSGFPREKGVSTRSVLEYAASVGLCK